MKHRRMVLSAALMMTSAGSSVAANMPPILSTLRVEHPRLLLTDDELGQLRARIEQDATLAAWVANLREEAGKILDQPPAAYEIPDGKRLLMVSRRVLDRVRTLALLHRLEGDPRYLARCWRELENAAAFVDWNPSHFLDAAEMTHAFAIGYDWLHRDWSEDQRARLCEAMLRHGLQPGLRCYRGESREGWWVKADHNWNSVCNGGLVLGALAVAETEPEIAGEILQGALASIPRAMKTFAPDGGYPEGPVYWAYGVSYTVYLIAGLQSALGSEFGLADCEGFDHTALFPLQLTGPTGVAFNFADATASPPSGTDALFWLASRFDSPQAMRVAAAWAKPRALDVVWYRRAVTADSMLPTFSYWRGVEVVTMRSAWHDAQATYLACKGGSPGVNHGQADLGGFILEAQGVRWAIDLGPDNYNLPGYFDRDHARWTYFRNRAESHNTLLVAPDAGPGQRVKAHAAFVPGVMTGDQQRALLDLTSAYGPQVEHYRRGYVLQSDHDVRIQDEVQTVASTRVIWSMHTRAGIEISEDGRRATLSQDGKQLHVDLLEPAKAAFSIRPCEPLATSPNPEGQAENGFATTLQVVLEDQTSLRLVVDLMPAVRERVQRPGVVPLSAWPGGDGLR